MWGTNLTTSVRCIELRTGIPVALHSVWSCSSVMIPNITWRMLVHVFSTERRIWYSRRGPSHVVLPLLRHVVPLNDGNCHPTIPVVKGRCARDAIPQAFGISVMKCGKQFYHNKTYLQRICEINWGFGSVAPFYIHHLWRIYFIYGTNTNNVEAMPRAQFSSSKV